MEPSWWLKLLDSIKSVPWQVSLTVGIAGLGLALAPPLAATIGAGAVSIALIAGLFFSVLFLVQMVGLGINRATTPRNQPFYITHRDGVTDCFWTCTKQQDESLAFHIVIRGLIKNKTDENLVITRIRLLKPDLHAENIQTFLPSGPVGPRDTVPMSVSLNLRIKTQPARGALKALIGFTNDDGHEEKVVILLRDPFVNGPMQGGFNPLQPNAVSFENPNAKQLIQGKNEGTEDEKQRK